MIFTAIIDGALCLVQKRSTVRNIDGKKYQVLITRILNVNTGVPMDIKEEIKEIK